MIQHTGKIDLACGDNKREGFFGIDKHKTASTDAEFDLLFFPWPIADESVEEVNCANFFEHIPAMQRKPFMEELHRVMKPGARLQITVPMGNRMWQDFTHQWPPVVPESFLYFNQAWLRENKLMHGDYVTSANFEFEFSYSLDPEIAAREQDFQRFGVRFFTNGATDLRVTLFKR